MRLKFTLLAALAAVGALLAASLALGAGSTSRHDHMHMAGTAAISASDLRVTLDRLFGEHAILAIQAMRTGYDGSPDFKPAAAQLDRNTVDLGYAVGLVYGAGARKAFLVQWRQHIGFFVDYTVGLARHDAKARSAALRDLSGYKRSFAAFLAKANPNLKAGPVASLLQVHVDELVAQINAWARKDYSAAYRLERVAYAHMFMTGDALAGGIAKQFPARFA